MKKRFVWANLGDGSTWPCPELATDLASVRWKLRFDLHSLSETEAVHAASVLEAYCSLMVRCDAKQREAVVKAVLKAIRQSMSNKDAT